VFRKDKAGRYVFVNSWFCRLKGAGAEAFLGRTPGEVSARDSGENPAPDPEASRAAAKAALLSEQHHEQILRTGQQLEVEEYYSDARKGEKYLQVVKSAIIGAGGEVVGSQGIIQDITQRKQAENELSRVHHQLVDASRAAGMAEVATNILHNVGNVLNSVNVSTTLVLEKIKQSKISNLGRVAALVQEHRDDLAAFLTADPKGKQLPEYLGRLSGHLNDEQAGLIQEMEATRRHIEHIKDIVATQQNYAKVSGVAEKVKLVDLVEDAVRMNSGSLARHEVELHRDYPAQLSDISVEKHKVLQILVNLIRNAKHACEETGRPDKQMTLQVRNGGDRVRITVSDNGVGIPAENLIRIFNHGFTTRKDGHGFGLHSSALAAKELGGTLTVASEGPGHGAAFTLEIPTQPTANP
jgi:signal transduction histidine kinase